MNPFVETNPTVDAYWRSIILFGRNSASYKFALGKSLLEAAAREYTFLPLEELARPYARNLVEHLRRTDRHATASSSLFLDACRQFARGETDEDELLAKTVRLGFGNVLDAFHVVNQGETPVRFFSDERKTRDGIVLTDSSSPSQKLPSTEISTARSRHAGGSWRPPGRLTCLRSCWWRGTPRS